FPGGSPGTPPNHSCPPFSLTRTDHSRARQFSASRTICNLLAAHAVIIVTEARLPMRYALRTLWRDRTFAAMVVVSLAIGVGANTAIFSMVSGVLLRPLDFPDPQHLVSVSISIPPFNGGAPLPINLAQMVEWRKRTRSFDAIGAYRNTTMSL